MGGLIALLIVVGLCVGAIYMMVKAWRWVRRWRVLVSVDYRDEVMIKIGKGFMPNESYNSVIVARVDPNEADFAQRLTRAKESAQARCNDLNRAARK